MKRASTRPSTCLQCTPVYRAFVSDEEDMRAFVKRPTFLPQVVYDVIKEATEDDNDMIVRYTTKTWQERKKIHHSQQRFSNWSLHSDSHEGRRSKQ